MVRFNKKNPIQIIAEAGVNHNGSLDLAKKLVDLAAEAGADVVKFQTFKSSALVSQFADKARYQTEATGSSESQLKMLQKLELSREAHFELKKYCESKKIEFLSTPFDESSLEFLVTELKVRLIKLGSGEITNAPLLLKTAQTGLPLILSTGMSSLAEVEEALGVLAFGYSLPKNTPPSREAFAQAYRTEAGQKQLREKVTLLHCTTEYPTLFKEVNLNAIKTLDQAFGLPVGFSDHTPGISVPIAVAAMNVSVIEKHITLDRTMAGPDHSASLSPQELITMVKSIREVELAMGDGVKIPQPSEVENKKVARKSLTAKTKIKAGEVFTFDNLTTKRPGHGISPLDLWDWIGKKSTRDYDEDETLT